ncbi:FtsQ-type POTRA domain-containing protein [Legionella israelensis]|uniref:Cell division protein FtsQ n=1 Tax=Legionella israelensis TaxID=454 RepID=A0AAX1EE62_9GAMM|nr:cell division protein FtsQ/DivIB [Legionella israelensis]QBR83390.1 FtsQ-type POTRA domain-containing protein [Legionella israelensis]
MKVGTESKIKSLGWRDKGILAFLFILAIFLTFRLGYLFLADAQRFPIHTVKIVASYRHITHKQLESVLSSYLKESFFSLSASKLQSALKSMDWVDKVFVKKVWPDALKITLIEKKPLAVFGNAFITSDGRLFQKGLVHHDMNLPVLQGPKEQQAKVLQVYQKLSKILSDYGLSLSKLQLRDNQAWELTLMNGTDLFLGKQNIEQRLVRFCKAYPALMAEKTEPPARVDLRYPRAMAIQWTR